MNQADLDGLVDGVLAEVWAHFRDHQDWPLKKPIMLALRAKGGDYDEVLRSSRGRLLRARSGSEERVFTTFRALAALEEVQQLFEPLPRLMRRAAERYIRHHQWAGEPEKAEVRITFEDLRTFWDKESEALLIARLLKECGDSPLQYGGAKGPLPTDLFLRPTLDTVRHEGVDTLDDVLRAAERPPRVRVGRYPSGNHLKVLRLIWAQAEKEGKWPTALPFAIEHRALGDVRQLVEELSPRFLKGGFRSGQYDSLSLSPQAVEFIDGDGQGKATLVAIARAAAEAWISSGASSRVELVEVARRANLDVARVHTWSLFLEWEPWGSVSRESGRATCFSIHDETCLKNEHLDSWSTYMTTWHPENDRDRDVERVDASTPSAMAVGEQLVPSLAFLSSDSLRRVVEADLRELNVLRASAASKAIFVIAGSLIEGVLVDVLNLRPDLAEQLLKKGHPKWPKDAGLSDLIDGAVRFNLIQPSVVGSLQVLKDYRDLVHPVNMSTTKLRARPDTAGLVLQALNVILQDLEEARLAGRITEYQNR
jgi:hypothetical protein